MLCYILQRIVNNKPMINHGNIDKKIEENKEIEKNKKEKQMKKRNIKEQ